MLQIALFLSIITSLAFSENEISSDDAIDTIEISMELFDTLSVYMDDDISDDGIPRVNCKGIVNKNICMNFGVTPLGLNGNGVYTGNRGSDNPGECIWLNKIKGPLYRAVGAGCIAPAKVRQYRQRKRNTPTQDVDDDAEVDSIEIGEEFFTQLSAKAFDSNDMDIDLSADTQITGCRKIRGKRACINNGVTLSGANGKGIHRGIRGNDGPGECMYFNLRNNPVVQYYGGSQCLSPYAVVSYNKMMRNNPPIVVASGEEDDSDIPTVELDVNTLYDLASYIGVSDDEIEAELLGNVCKEMKKRDPCFRTSSVKGSNGVYTGRRGNENYGECMWFSSKKNEIVRAFGGRCVPPAFVKKYRQNQPLLLGQDETEEVMVEGDDDGIDTIEMSEGLFDLLSENAPELEEDDLSEEMMKYCLQIKKEKLCLRSSSRLAPTGRFTNRRGNKGRGECMYFPSKRGKVPRAFGGQQCLPPAQVVYYKQTGRLPPIAMEQELFAALGLINEEDNSLNYDVLSMAFVMMVLIGFGAYYKLCKNYNYKKESLLNGVEGRQSHYQSV